MFKIIFKEMLKMISHYKGKREKGILRKKQGIHYAIKLIY